MLRRGQWSVRASELGGATRRRRERLSGGIFARWRLPWKHDVFTMGVSACIDLPLNFSRIFLHGNPAARAPAAALCPSSGAPWWSRKPVFTRIEIQCRVYHAADKPVKRGRPARKRCSGRAFAKNQKPPPLHRAQPLSYDVTKQVPSPVRSGSGMMIDKDDDNGDRWTSSEALLARFDKSMRECLSECSLILRWFNDLEISMVRGAEFQARVRARFKRERRIANRRVFTSSSRPAPSSSPRQNLSRLAFKPQNCTRRHFGWQTQRRVNHDCQQRWWKREKNHRAIPRRAARLSRFSRETGKRLRGRRAS